MVMLLHYMIISYLWVFLQKWLKVKDYGNRGRCSVPSRNRRLYVHCCINTHAHTWLSLLPTTESSSWLFSSEARESICKLALLFLALCGASTTICIVYYRVILIETFVTVRDVWGKQVRFENIFKVIKYIFKVIFWRSLLNVFYYKNRKRNVFIWYLKR